ncbi:MAG: MAPEG family protein [Chakrabartia sp.]
MTQEITWLMYTLLLTTLMSMPYVVNRIVVRGQRAALYDPRGESEGSLSPWAQRLFNAHANAVENLAIFAPAVLAVQVLGLSSPLTQMAAAVYFFARVGHVAAYAVHIPIARTMAYTVAWMAQIAIVAHVLGWV